MRTVDAHLIENLLQMRGSYHGVIAYDTVIEVLHDTPTIEPEPQWFPTTELLPKNDDWVIVTVLDESGDTPYRYTHFGWYLEAVDGWIIDNERRNDVIAWMPLPTPWKAGRR